MIEDLLKNELISCNFLYWYYIAPNSFRKIEKDVEDFQKTNKHNFSN